ncbi:hypothetical protein H5410_021581 [Solanum commersonii]|uniref:Uncharacterized protein n=1 Tax=Solanum commersonii TaxID=4109 RepID=A0A9J5ZFI8_SOLCO|nr:hypothetical protein H5410_021581 [Solanum commersonii]
MACPRRSSPLFVDLSKLLVTWDFASGCFCRSLVAATFMLLLSLKERREEKRGAVKGEEDDRRSLSPATGGFRLLAVKRKNEMRRGKGRKGSGERGGRTRVSWRGAAASGDALLNQAAASSVALVGEDGRRGAALRTKRGRERLFLGLEYEIKVGLDLVCPIKATNGWDLIKDQSCVAKLKKPILVKPVQQLPVTDPKVVPWNYNKIVVFYQGKEIVEEVDEARRLTRSRRCYSPKELRKGKMAQDIQVPLKKEIIVHGEYDLSIYKDPSIPYIEAKEACASVVYKSFEIISVDRFKEEDLMSNHVSLLPIQCFVNVGFDNMAYMQNSLPDLKELFILESPSQEVEYDDE